VIDTTERVEDFAVHLQMLLDKVTLAVYTNVSRGLFERHKLVFSFMLCASIFKQSGIVSESQWNFLLHGPVPVGMVSHLKMYRYMCTLLVS
jgi:dynein heavy chain